MTGDTDDLAALRARVMRRQQALTRDEYRATRGRHASDAWLLAAGVVVMVSMLMGWL